jgi:uncharacterized membrane protein YkgB
MTAVKERILGALTVMSNEDAEKIWIIIKNNFDSTLWDDIEEVVPDEWDLKMLKEIDENPDCKEFVSEDELYKALDL